MVLSASLEPRSGYAALWRAWDPEFFRDGPLDEKRIAEVRRVFEDRHGASLDPGHRTDSRSLSIVPAVPEDSLAAAREAQAYDFARAGDLFAHAVRAGRIEELSPDERGRAGHVLLATEPSRALPLLEEAARGGSADADVTIGQYLVGRDARDADWEPALAHFRRAADRGHAYAAYLVGFYYDQIVRGRVGAVDWRQFASPGLPFEPAPDDPAHRRAPLVRARRRRWVAGGRRTARPDLARGARRRYVTRSAVSSLRRNAIARPHHQVRQTRTRARSWAQPHRGAPD